MATAEMPTVTRDELILLIAGGATGPYELDPIRVMKGCFLISQLGRAPLREPFNFRPYDYGPFDASVYGARDSLVREGLLAAKSHGRYDSYVLTDAGRERVRDIERVLGKKDADWVRRIGNYVSSKSFSRLLDEVYARWPEFATRSVAFR